MKSYRYKKPQTKEVSTKDRLFTATLNCKKCMKNWQMNEVFYNQKSQCNLCLGRVHPSRLEDGKIVFKLDMRYYGYYQCQPCNRQWSSGNSYMNSFQQCTKCKKNIYPYELHFLQQSEDQQQNDRPHLSSLCQRCQRGQKCRGGSRY